METSQMPYIHFSLLIKGRDSCPLLTQQTVRYLGTEGEVFSSILNTNVQSQSKEILN
jgi:hypothetical protein